MVRSLDPPGVDKHLRFEKKEGLDQIKEALLHFPGVKAMVLHTHGKSGEHPHLHVWYESPKEITNQTVRNRMMKVEALSHFSGQHEWSFRNHDSWVTWCTYVTKNETHEVLLDYTRDECTLSIMSKKAKELNSDLLILPASIIDPDLSTPAGLNAPARAKRASETMRAKFCKYLERDCHYHRNESITMDNYPVKLDDLVDRMTDFWENAFTTPQGAVCVEHAKYIFGNDEYREYIRKRNIQAITKCLR